MPKPLAPIKHGTIQGYQQHLYRRARGLPEEECPPRKDCAQAKRDWNGEHRIASPEKTSKEARYVVVIVGDNLSEMDVMGPFTAKARADKAAAGWRVKRKGARIRVRPLIPISRKPAEASDE